MGAISFTLDLDLVRELQRHLPLAQFVETGTFRGESLEQVRALFAHCLSIELSQEYYDAAVERFAGTANVQLVHGDSPVTLRQQRVLFAGQPTLFWLDAHWCAADDTAGEKSQCPLLNELAAIGPLHAQSVVLIDDARLFLCPPPKPHEISAWPDFDAVVRGLRAIAPDHALVCFNDVLLYIPAAILPMLRPFLHQRAFNLLTYADKARDFDTLLSQAKEKDRAIVEKETEIQQKSAEIQRTHLTANERLHALEQSDRAASERLLALNQSESAASERLLALEQSELAAKERLVAWEQSERVAKERLLAWEQSERVAKERLFAWEQSERAASAKEDELQGLHSAATERLDALHQLTRATQEKDAEIQRLHTAATERLDGMVRLDAEVNRLREVLRTREPDYVPATESAGDVELRQARVRLVEARRQLKVSELKLTQRDREIRELRSRSVEPAKPGLIPRWLDRWGARLAANSPHPLGKLRQYPPRSLVLENFPRVPKLRQWPRMCVITPSYQQAPFLERTMRSVLDQGYPNLAYGVQDGGSRDGSAQIIENHLTQLAHAESAPDEGQSDAIRRGFTKLYPGHADIMAWVNSDDTLMPGALHAVGAYFARHPEVDVVYGHRVIIDENDQEVGRWYLPRYHADTLKWFDFVPQETLFWRAHCYEEIGGLDPSFQFAMDWDLLMRFEQACFTIRRLPFFLGCFRVHPEQKTSAKIMTVGEQEMSRLRLRTHEREVAHREIHEQLAAEVNRSGVVTWLHQRGIRW